MPVGRAAGSQSHILCATSLLGHAHHIPGPKTDGIFGGRWIVVGQSGCCCRDAQRCTPRSRKRVPRSCRTNTVPMSYPHENHDARFSLASIAASRGFAMPERKRAKKLRFMKWTTNHKREEASALSCVESPALHRTLRRVIEWQFCTSRGAAFCVRPPPTVLQWWQLSQKPSNGDRQCCFFDVRCALWDPDDVNGCVALRLILVSSAHLPRSSRTLSAVTYRATSRVCKRKPDRQDEKEGSNINLEHSWTDKHRFPGTPKQSCRSARTALAKRSIGCWFAFLQNFEIGNVDTRLPTH